MEHDPYGDPRRMRICEAWAAVYGLRDVGLRTLRFFVNCWRATDTYEGAASVYGAGKPMKIKDRAAGYGPADLAGDG